MNKSVRITIAIVATCALAGGAVALHVRNDAREASSTAKAADAKQQAAIAAERANQQAKIDAKIALENAIAEARAFCSGDRDAVVLTNVDVNRRVKKNCPDRRRAALKAELAEARQVQEAQDDDDYFPSDGDVYSSDNELDFAAEDHTCEELQTWYDYNPADSNIDIARQYFIMCDGDIPPPVLSGEINDAEEFFG